MLALPVSITIVHKASRHRPAHPHQPVLGIVVQGIGHPYVGACSYVTIRVHIITANYGKELAGHEKIARDLKADFFFARPYAPWERGSNENMNGLIRQYISKKREFKSNNETEVELEIHRFNNMPRSVLVSCHVSKCFLVNLLNFRVYSAYIYNIFHFYFLSILVIIPIFLVVQGNIRKLRFLN